MNVYVILSIELMRFALTLLLVHIDIREKHLPNVLNTLFFLICLTDALLSRTSFAVIFLLFVILLVPLYIVSMIGYRQDHVLLGMGDVKLLVSLCCWLDMAIVPVLFFASLSAALPLALRTRKRGPSRPTIPFAPYLLGYAWLFTACKALGLV